jgi:glycosyltransferase involved in cell wall biosynthesis
VVCTHNRSTLLAPCLESLALQTLPSSDFEIIVVDDGSTDATPAVCARFKHLPHLRVIQQPNAGLGAARERGWRAGSAPVVAFLDDDAEAPPDWLALALARFDHNAANPFPPAALGGPTRGKWEAPRPPWLDDSLAIWLTVWNPFAEYRESPEEHLFVGANMFFLRSALETVNGFNAALGRRGASLLSHEESELWSRLQAAGFRSAYDPAVWVYHFVPAGRLHRAWFRRRIFWEGVSVTRSGRRQSQSPRPALALAAVCSAFFARQVFAHLAHPARWGRSLSWQLHIAYKLGCARELLRPARDVTA